MKKDSIVCHPDRETIQLIVINRGDRPVQIGSHVHFYEVNAQLEFDRNKAYGHRLHIPAGTAVRFEPGEEKPVELTSFGGKRKIQGFNNLTNGPLDQPADEAKLKTFIERFGAPAANNEGDPS